ncbi:cyclin-dependent kinase inhibitor 7-like isoform X2 [Cynara cardunculus var. scolymus]|uniref:cyclin-dependent kinase inhibitor 7-like isoform X2 n=1 Tax=Cynara cardunculus var. scolymus TaxID=59895 RepID=UPI000D62B6FD|nr:cyclin-dependent kinase inhibitor 7-like isoform X2 [Cynara cardunculus var. scolymus]
MVEYIRKCSNGVGEVVVVDSDQVGMRTRAVAAEEEEGAEKRRKVGNGELRLPLPTLVQITTAGEIRYPCTASAASRSSDHVPVSCCSRNGSTEERQFTDLEEIVEIGAVARCSLDSRASKRRSELKAGSGEQKTITANQSTVINSRRTMPAEKMPPAAELEEFFASAETELHKRFKDKYNYDIVNDTPLEGRFQWVQVKP